jgi:hypothetical protein
LLVFAPQNDARDQLINVRFLPSIAAPDNVDGRPERVMKSPSPTLREGLVGARRSLCPWVMTTSRILLKAALCLGKPNGAEYWRSIRSVRTPLLRANILFRGVEVTAGRHIVEFEYRPFSIENLLAALKSVLHKSET